MTQRQQKLACRAGCSTSDGEVKVEDSLPPDFVIAVVNFNTTLLISDQLETKSVLKEEIEVLNYSTLYLTQAANINFPADHSLE